MLNNIKENIEITNFSSFRTKAFTKYFYEINREEDVYKLKELFDFFNEKNLDLTILWRGTNTLFAFDEYNWIIIKNNLKGWNYNQDTKILESFSNEVISNIALSLKNNYNNDIWYRFIWLPGGVWWAVFGNAWCFWLETWNNFLEAKLYNLKTWQIEIFNKSDMNFSYRNSFIKENYNNYFIISIKFDLSRVEEKYSSDADIIEFRKKKQPKWFSCWSFFSNPSQDHPAWKLIEEVWLKWYKLWGAYFSDQHANFLMSDGTATYKDLLSLMDLAKQKVKKEKGIDLITEVRIIKNDRS